LETDLYKIKDRNINMKQYILVLSVVAFLGSLISQKSLAQNIISFPGAEGAGKFAEGGRGGDVYHVTSLEDAGEGSFRKGIDEADGPRTIVFDVAGTIRLKSKLLIEKQSYLTIAGQTAPGKGITLADHTLVIKHSNHIVVRYLRVRLGDENKPAPSGPDCITVEYCEDIILDHLSLSWGIDGNGDFRGLKNTTIQWTIFSEALNNSLHKKGAHAMSSSFRQPKGQATLHHNIYASSRERHPSIGGGESVLEFCNNLDYNWKNSNNISGQQLNVIGNYYKPGPSSVHGVLPIQYKTGKDSPNSQVFLLENYFEGMTDQYNEDNYTAVNYAPCFWPRKTDYRGTYREDFEVAKRHDAGIYKLTEIESAKEAYESCLKYSGCSMVRDAVDERFIKTIIDNTGKIIDSQSEVGGWDFYETIQRPKKWDTDKDGMPNTWEKANGLNPNDSEDRNGDADKDGYTNLEEYMNGLVINYK